MHFQKYLIIAVSLSFTACATYTSEQLPVAAKAQTAAELTKILYRNNEVTDTRFLPAFPIDLSAALDSNAVATLAVLHNPDLSALRATLGVADAQVFAAGLMPDPVFNVGADKVLSGPDQLNNLSAALGFDLNFLRTRGVRITQARAAAAQARMDVAWAEWQTAGEARLLVERVNSLQLLQAQAANNQQLAASMLASMQKAARQGDVAVTQMQVTAAAANVAEQAAIQVQGDLAAARLELNALLGLPADFTLQLVPAVGGMEAAMATSLPDLETLYSQAALARADLVALRLGYDAQEAAVHKAVLDQFPGLNLAITGSRDTSGNRLLGPALDFSLPLWNRNRGGIAIEKATRAVLQKEYAARLLQTRADLAAALANIALAYRQQQGLQNGLADLQQLAKSNRTASSRGDVPVTAAVAAEQNLFERQSQLLQAQQSVAEHMIALELLSGAARDQWGKTHE